MEFLNVGDFASQLDGIVQAAGRAGAGAVVLELARSLLGRLREASVDERPRESDGWQAARLRDGPLEEEIACWQHNADIRGTWAAGTLKYLHVGIGGQFWAMRATPGGESFMSTDESVKGPAELATEANNTGVLDRELKQWEKSRPADGWTCARCGWTNKEAERGCALCGTPGDTLAAVPSAEILGRLPGVWQPKRAARPADEPVDGPSRTSVMATSCSRASTPTARCVSSGPLPTDASAPALDGRAWRRSSRCSNTYPRSCAQTCPPQWPRKSSDTSRRPGHRPGSNAAMTDPRFLQAEERFRYLKAELEAGRITGDDFERALWD